MEWGHCLSAAGAGGRGRFSVHGATRMLTAMRGHIIDGERWITERLTLLKERLAAQPGDDERRAIEAEIEILSKERGIGLGGLRGKRISRRLRRST